MEKKREIFLFGAGAVIDWNAPLTTEITETIRETGYSLKNSNTRITEFIYQRLIKCGYKDSEINFETIINVIEELIVYYSEFNKETNSPSLLKSFFSENDLTEIFNYSIKGGVRKHGYELQIPYGVDYNFSKRAYYDENPNQFFLQHLLTLLLSVISDMVSEYSWYTEDDAVIIMETDNSLNFRSWIKTIKNNSIVRLYTLNYDNLFKSLLHQDNIECFEGFFEQNKSSYSSRADVLKILTDTNSTIHYNLHGSSYWRVISTDKNNLPNTEIVLETGIGLQMNDMSAPFQMEKGKTILITNIITGYQKAQKSMVTPFKQMQASFDKDCLLADKITIIGYSFGDEHINESIKTALRYNEKLKLEIVAPNVLDYDLYFVTRLFPFVEKDNWYPPKNLISSSVYGFFRKNRVVAYKMTFSEYLKFKNNPLSPQF